MSVTISRLSSPTDIIAWLKEKIIEEAVEEFQANEIDGEDFFDLELKDVNQLIPRLKIRKRFLSEWSKITKENFDINGLRCPLQKPASTPVVVKTDVAITTPVTPSPEFLLMNSTSQTEREEDGSDSSLLCDSPPSKKSLQFETPDVSLRRSPRKHKGSSSCSRSSSSISPKKTKLV